MSMHKTPLTPTEEAGMRAHGLQRNIGKPSQLADVFRQGVAWGQKAEREALDKMLDDIGATLQTEDKSLDFWHGVGAMVEAGEAAIAARSNAKVSGAGTASAGLPGYA